MGEAWIIDGVRSPRGGGKPASARCTTSIRRSARAGAQCAEGPRRGSTRPTSTTSSSATAPASAITAMCIGRMSVLAAGWPVRRRASSLNRFCGSGQQAVTVAAMGIQAGHQDLVVGGGVESMSRPAAVDGARDFTAGNAPCARSTRSCPRASRPT